MSLAQKQAVVCCNHKEADTVWAQGKPLFELAVDGSVLTPVTQWPGPRIVLDVEQTRERLRVFRTQRVEQGLSAVPVREPFLNKPRP